MKRRRATEISARKAPRQARSAQLVADTLEAAIRILRREGAQRFTAARVAEEAGISVGSLYQYFPNKESILFRLQTDEWARTGALLEAIMRDTTREPAVRLRALVAAFFRSEWEEAALRLALGDAAPAYRDAPEVAAHRRSGRRRTARFMLELLPQASMEQRRFTGELLMGVISSMGKSVSENAKSAADVDSWGSAIGDMLCAYLERDAAQSGRRVKERLGSVRR